MKERNMSFRSLLIAFAMLVGLVALSPAQASPLLQVDITNLWNPDGSWSPNLYTPQPGWSNFEIGTSATHYTGDWRPSVPLWETFGSLTVTITPGQFTVPDWGPAWYQEQMFGFDASNVLTNGGGLTLANMLQVGITSPLMNVSVSGLTPGTTYTVNAYAYTGADSSSTWYKYESGSWQSLGVVTLPGGAPNDTSNEVTFNIVSDATGTITFCPGPGYDLNYVGYPTIPCNINGLELSAAPEPATMALLAIGGIGALLRRRK
jgi:hypothetical protein